MCELYEPYGELGPRRCASCFQLSERLDDEDVCPECRGEAEHERQIRSDYNRSVL